MGDESWMRCVKRYKKALHFRPCLTAILATWLILAPVGASAFDFFGLFGSDEPPNPSPSTLPYRVEFVVHGDDGVKDALQDSSNFYKLRQDPPPGRTKVRRGTIVTVHLYRGVG